MNVIQKAELCPIINHNLKIATIYYDKILSGAKTAELRFNDRNFKVDDTITLHPLCSKKKPIVAVITDVCDDQPALKDGYVMLSFKLLGGDHHAVVG